MPTRLSTQVRKTTNICIYLYICVYVYMYSKCISVVQTYVFIRASLCRHDESRTAPHEPPSWVTHALEVSSFSVLFLSLPSLHERVRFNRRTLNSSPQVSRFLCLDRHWDVLGIRREDRGLVEECPLCQLGVWHPSSSLLVCLFLRL